MEMMFKGDEVLQRRYDKLYGPKPARPAPVPTFSVAEIMRNAPVRSAEEIAEIDRVKRSARARVELDRALEAEARDASRAQRQATVETLTNTSVGRMLGGRS
jgi:hypothetical protein